MTRIEQICLAWRLSAMRPWYTRPLHCLNWRLFAGRTNRLYRLARYLEGARPVRTGHYGPDNDEISGSYYRRMFTDVAGERFEMVRVDFSGACPVQGEGHVFGYPCYYRSRGEGWQFYVARSRDGDPLDDDAWVYSEQRYIFPQGGWVQAGVSMACISRAVDAWLEDADRTWRRGDGQ